MDLPRLKTALVDRGHTVWVIEHNLAMIRQARTLTDPKARIKLYQEMQVMVHDAQPDDKIAHSVVFEVLRKEVVGLADDRLDALVAGVDRIGDAGPCGGAGVGRGAELGEGRIRDHRGLPMPRL